MNTGIG